MNKKDLIENPGNMIYGIWAGVSPSAGAVERTDAIDTLLFISHMIDMRGETRPRVIQETKDAALLCQDEVVISDDGLPVARTDKGIELAEQAVKEARLNPGTATAKKILERHDPCFKM